MDHLLFNRRAMALFMFFHVFLQLCGTDIIASDQYDRPRNIREKRRSELDRRIYLLGDNSSDFVTIPNLLPNLFPPSTVEDRTNEVGKLDNITSLLTDALNETKTVEPIHPHETVKFSTLRMHDETTEANAFTRKVGPSRMSGSLFQMLQNLNNKERLSKDVKSILQSDRGRNFINGLKNDFQREVVLTNLEHCPFLPLCHFSLDLDPGNYGVIGTALCCSKCSCNKDVCISTGTCCPDVPWFVQKPAYMERGVHKRCIPSEIKGTNTGSVNHVKGVTGCPIHSDSNLVLKCMRDYERDVDDIRLDDITLVWDISRELLYRNKYCADCNGVNRSSQMAWSIQLECLYQVPSVNSAKELITKVIRGDLSCDIIYMRPETKWKAESCSTAISTCNSTGLWQSYDIVIDMACSLYGSIIHIEVQDNDYIAFRNVFCAFCNGYDPSPVDMCFIAHSFRPVVDFATLLKLSDHEGIQEKKDQCRTGEKYDNVKVNNFRLLSLY